MIISFVVGAESSRCIKSSGHALGKRPCYLSLRDSRRNIVYIELSTYHTICNLNDWSSFQVQSKLNLIRRERNKIINKKNRSNGKRNYLLLLHLSNRSHNCVFINVTTWLKNINFFMFMPSIYS